MTHRFLGLDADEWEAADGLPAWSDMVGGPVTIDDVKAAIVGMLRRLNDEDAPLDIEPIEATWTVHGEDVTETHYVIHGVRCINEQGLDVTVRKATDDDW